MHACTLAAPRALAAVVWFAIPWAVAAAPLAALPGDRQTLYFSPSEQSPVPQTPGALTDPRTFLSTITGPLSATGQSGPTLDFMQRMLKIDRAKGDVPAQMRDLDRMGTMRARAGDLAAAMHDLQEAVALVKPSTDPVLEANLRTDVGVVDALVGKFPEALQSLERAKTLYGMRMSPPARSTTTPADPLSFAARAALATSLTTVEAARRGLTVTLADLGAIHAHLGQFTEAVSAYEDAQSRVPDQEAVLRGLAATYRQLAMSKQAAGDAKQAARANSQADEYAASARAHGGSDVVALSLLGGDSIALGAPADAASGAPGRPLAATDALAVAQSAATQQIARADAGARQAQSQGRFDDAIADWRKAAIVAGVAGLADARRNAYVQLAGVASQARRPGLAVFYGKRALAALQQQREQLAAMGHDARNAFTVQARPVYERLASALMDLDRLPEARRVLDLLHNDIAGQFAAADDALPDDAAERAFAAHDDALAARWRENAATMATLQREQPYLPANLSDEEMDGVRDKSLENAETMLTAMENAAAGGPSAMTGLRMMMPSVRAQIEPALKPVTCGATTVPASPRARALAARFAALEQRVGTAAGASQGMVPGFPAMGGAMMPPELDRLWCLQHAQASLLAEASTINEATSRALDAAPTFAAADQASLARDRIAAGDHAIALHYLVGDHALRILVTASSGRTVHVVPVERSALQALVTQLRAAMQDPASDPMPSARTLHALLIAPAQPDIERAHAQTLLLSPDDALRAVPFAALHDGQGWLVERTALALADFGAPAAAPKPARAWRVAAFGNTRGNGDLRALHAVDGELHDLVNNPAEGMHGALPGIARLDPAFTAQSLRDALAQHYPVIHIASHFVLSDNGPAESWLLLGDGTHLSLPQLRQGYRFDGVELVTLSACETALDQRDPIYGQQFEGLAGVLHDQGAAAVVATLWSVDDASTGVFMRVMYEAHEQGHASRAESLRQAQRALIDGKIPGSTRKYAHPYFWAPFVLMGAWQ